MGFQYRQIQRKRLIQKKKNQKIGRCKNYLPIKFIIGILILKDFLLPILIPYPKNKLFHILYYTLVSHHLLQYSDQFNIFILFVIKTTITIVFSAIIKLTHLFLPILYKKFNPIINRNIKIRTVVAGVCEGTWVIRGASATQVSFRFYLLILVFQYIKLLINKLLSLATQQSLICYLILLAISYLPALFLIPKKKVTLYQIKYIK